MQFRRFEPADAPSVSALVAHTMMTTNIKDYSAKYLQADIDRMTPQWFIEKAAQTHFYVRVDNDVIKACGAIGSYWGKRDEVSLFAVFVAPEVQGQGFGRQLMGTLLNDPLAEYARRIEIPASITAVGFYQKFGFVGKNGLDSDEAQLVRLERWCPFCTLSTDRIIDQNELALAFFDRSPVAPGHLLVIPKRHCHDFFALTPEELTAIQDLLQRGKAWLEQTSHPDGYNVGFNVNAASGQSVWHAHCHLIPRWTGDVPYARGGIRQILGGD
ncbi:GNAT family acetyltransferase [Lacticaseibacillus manihotivorans DSM 13343 = JCM 12514]|uniref:GNAT family acetyltransferase n=1 Tax=Lacticaseibacillus manihotivorans DSM 13343 = JCM 12514 TaxID=1423769 RepID=A0A0R1QE44_9LACO|nr:GNAT family acetyltransferase [Lacticaseibacillus manihotivorans DSM 13343 = JCM 12514]